MRRIAVIPRLVQSPDRIADSAIMLLMMTVLQRVIGFFRAMVICRWLDPVELGQWDMAWGFIELAAPLAMLGLPGSFGRYVEHYRQRNQLKPFLYRTAVVTAIAAFCGIGAMFIHRERFSCLIFGTPEKTSLVMLITFGLFAVIAYYFLTTLLTSLRRSRIVSCLEFANSVLFAGLAIVLIACWQVGTASIVVGYSVACLATSLIAARSLRTIWEGLPRTEQPLAQYEMWSKLLPFAFWVWSTNWLANVFEVADRYMMVHYGGFNAAQAMIEVGNYHSSRLLPLLLVSITGLLGTMLTPYLSHDWETGGAQAASARLNMTLKMLGMALLVGGLGILILAPVLFEVALDGKYSGGLAVLPMTLTYCVWFGMARVAQKYLWCAERVRLAAIAWLLGLVVNIALNLVLLPRYGLVGVVGATAAGNFTSLITIYLFNRLYSMQSDSGTWLLSAAPTLLMLGPLYAACGAAAIVWMAARTNWLLSRDEKEQLRNVFDEYVRRAGAWMTGPKSAVLKEASS